MKLLLALLALGALAAPDGKRCRSATECPAGWSCSSPEELRMNWCGKRSFENDCGPGEVADACGACFRACKKNADCRKGQTCSGSICISARHCSPPRRPPQ
jgi:hypothetical protein